MRLSASNLALVRDTKAHYTDLYLSVFQPNLVLQCQVNDASIARGEREITFDNTTAGSWQNVKIGSTLLVGSSVGARNVGKVRVKSITSSVITIAENSHIKWADDLYLTVLDYFDIWPIFPRIIQDPSDAEQTIWYKDYDILYSNQNTNLGAFMNIGPHRAAFIENGSAPLFFSASGTYPLSGTVSDVQWVFQSGTPGTYHGTTPGNVSWGTPGNYLTQCIISGSTGWVETGYRYVSIYNLPSAGTNIPVSKWEVTALQGSRAEGGYTATITVFEPVVVEEGSIVVLFADEWYGSTRGSLGGNAPNASSIKFVGYVLDNSIRYDYKSSSVSFDVGSITQVMKDLEGFAVGVNSVASPTDWFELQDMNAKKAVYHYWKWHSNIISLSDIEFIGEDFPIQYFDSDRESLFDAVDNFLRTSYHAATVADRQGKIYLETDAWVRPNATGTFSPIFNLSKYDWIGEPNITERRMPELSYLEYNGIAYSGAVTGTSSPLLTNAPGSTPGYRGESNRQPGFAIGGQGQLNQLAGDEFEHRNTKYPFIDFSMRGNWSNLDIAPQEVSQVDIAAADTVRNVAINGLYQPTNVAWQISTKNKTLMPRVTWGVVTSGEPGETIVIPEVVDDGGYGNPTRGGFTIPTVIPPSIPVFVGGFIQTRFGAGTILPATSDPVQLDLLLMYSSGMFVSSGTFTSSSGTFYNANEIVIPYSGYYRLSFAGTVTLPGSGNVGNIKDVRLLLTVNGVEDSDLLSIGANIQDGETAFYQFGESSGYTVIHPLSAGQTLGVAFTTDDFTPIGPQQYSYRGRLLAEFIG